VGEVDLLAGAPADAPPGAALPTARRHLRPPAGARPNPFTLGNYRALLTASTGRVAPSPAGWRTSIR
jgi:hypothetical protein